MGGERDEGVQVRQRLKPGRAPVFADRGAKGATERAATARCYPGGLCSGRRRMGWVEGSIAFWTGRADVCWLVLAGSSDARVTSAVCGVFLCNGNTGNTWRHGDHEVCTLRLRTATSGRRCWAEECDAAQLAPEPCGPIKGTRRGLGGTSVRSSFTLAGSHPSPVPPPQRGSCSSRRPVQRCFLKRPPSATARKRTRRQVSAQRQRQRQQFWR